MSSTVTTGSYLANVAMLGGIKIDEQTGKYESLVGGGSNGASTTQLVAGFTGSTTGSVIAALNFVYEQSSEGQVTTGGSNTFTGANVFQGSLSGTNGVSFKDGANGILVSQGDGVTLGSAGANTMLMGTAVTSNSPVTLGGTFTASNGINVPSHFLASDGTIEVSGILTASAAASFASTVHVGGVMTAAGNIVPASDDAVDLGSSAAEFKDLYLDGVAYIDSLQATQLGAALDANSQAITNINVDSGDISGADVTVGASKTLDVSAGTLTTSAAQKAAIVEGVGANVDIGAFDLRAQTLTADGLTSGRVVFAGANGVLSDDSDFSFATDTLTVTKIGAFEAAGAINFASQAMTNVDINSGAIDGANIGAASRGTAAFTTLDANGNVTLGSDANDVITINGEITASVGMLIKDNQKLYFGDGFDASIEYDEDGDDELKFAGAAVAFAQAVSFDANVTLGDAATDVTTVTGLLSASQDITLAADKDVHFQGGGGPVIYDSENSQYYRIEVQGGLMVLNPLGDHF